MKHTKKIHFKKAAALGLSLLMLAGALGGCGDNAQSVTDDQTQTGNAQSVTDDQEQAGDAQSMTNDQGQAGDAQSVTDSQVQTENVQGDDSREAVTIRVGSLKGPTSLGLLSLMDKSSQGGTTDNYEFQMTTGADELLPLMVKGDLDIVLVPANVAATLYQKTNVGVEVIEINTLSVLYMVTGKAEVRSVADHEGKTV